MKRYIVLLQNLVSLRARKEPREMVKIRMCHAAEKIAGRNHGVDQLDVPTFIRQGRVLSIYS
jgi:hypothetical protein